MVSSLQLSVLACAISAACAQTVDSAPGDLECTDPSPSHKCFQQRVVFFEGLILWGVILLAALMGTTCLAALNTPTKFPQPKERTD